MHSTKTENVALENLLDEYFRTRSFFTYGELKNGKSLIHEKNAAHKKYNKPKKSVFEFETFCSMTSLHGFYNLGGNTFNKIGKFFWVICLVAMYCLCGLAIFQSIKEFSRMPAIISLDNSVSSIWNIPFPAITICSANKLRPSVYDYYNNSTDMNDLLIKNSLHGVCEKNPFKKSSKYFEEYLDGSLVSNVLKNMSFRCEEVVKSFFWLLLIENNPCTLWFQETFTSYGLCYSFNMMPLRDVLNGVDEWSQDGNYNWKNYRSNWHPDTGYDDNALANNLPMRTFGEGDYHSATMKLDFHNEDSNEECAHGLEIFYILIHSPAEWPDRSHPTLLAPVNTLQTMSVKPIVLNTVQELTSWNSFARNCYYQNEKKLKFFNIYTKKNCMLECRTNMVLKQCGCVAFYHIRLKNTPVCGPAKMSCWVIASQSSLDLCNCLPGCSELHFKITSMNAPFNNTQKMSGNFSMYSSVFLGVFYQSKNYIGLNRILTFTLGQLMGNVGGIMGLCLGFSFLSLTEVIYFLTLRPFVNLWNTKKNMKKVDAARILAKPRFNY